MLQANGRDLSPLQASASSLGSVSFNYDCWLVHLASTLKSQVELFLLLASFFSSGSKWSIQFLLDVLSSSGMRHESLGQVRLLGLNLGIFHSLFQPPIPIFFSQDSQLLIASGFEPVFLFLGSFI